MPVNLTLYIAWDGPRNQYDTDDIIEVVPYIGSNLPPYDGAPWVHIHVLNAPWPTVQEAKDFLLKPNTAEEDPQVPEDAVIINWRALRVSKVDIPSQVVNTLDRERTFQFDWAVITDATIYSKKQQRLLTLLDWPTE